MSQWSVVCLCAGWCGVCKEYAAVFDGLAARHPEVAFHWVDIEDDADAVGDVDIETFPTLLVARGEGVYHFGPLTPQPEVLARLLAGFMADPERRMASQAGTQALWQAVQGVLGPGSRRLGAELLKTQA
ncbi:thioredoxin family protein [Curvibacter sp. HBC61]|uniref:Thioredoxin family protein n=1 Tax=Curvibacter cyanobacteriorum TaxID=3026422 RepID=A0ABT5MXG0_9BURK|nr:thioredoxin family protein [Curvibacter sp. HBC61]MDD0837428.1 thioredoxin family protein [Curvibacter sp. HBC61]